MTHDLREALSGLEHSNLELDQRRRYMEIVLRTVDAGVVSLDADGRISTVNPSALRLLGVLPGHRRSSGSKLEEVLERPEVLSVLRELAVQARPGVRESVRQQVVVPSGDELLTLVVTLSLLQDDEGRGARLRDRVRRLHAGGARAAHGRVARGRAAHRARDQEPADADPAVGAAHPAALPGALRGRVRRRPGLRRVRGHHREPRRRAEGAGERVLPVRAPAHRRARSPTT